MYDSAFPKNSIDKTFIDFQDKVNISSKDYLRLRIICAGQYTLRDDAAMAVVKIIRSCGNLSRHVVVNYKTRDETAKAGKDYIQDEGFETI